MTEDLQLMRDDIVNTAYDDLVALVNAMIKTAVLQERERCDDLAPMKFTTKEKTNE